MTNMGRAAVYVFAEDPDLDVLDAARERVAHVFKRFDTPVVSFSGGKDSTVVLHLALEEARSRGQALHVAYIDEEIIDPPTLAYLERVRTLEGVEFHWLCVPLRHTLRSQQRISWWTWDPEYRDLWARDMPPWAITEVEGYERERATHGRIIDWRFPRAEYGEVCQVLGIRIDEALNRRRQFRNSGDFIMRSGGAIWTAKPIYDWKTQDVWHVIYREGWDYSAFYTEVKRAGLTALSQQRISSWGNVSGAKDAALFRVLWPDLRERATRRLPELADMARYARTHLYRKGIKKPAGLTWQEWAYHVIAAIDNEEQRKAWLHKVASIVECWERIASTPFPETDLPGFKDQSWKRLCALIAKNDLTMRDAL